MAVIIIDKDNFEAEVINSEVPVLVDFWASWCGPCKMLSPIVDMVADEIESIKVCKINVDENPDLAIEYKVMSIPMLILFKNGEVSKKSIGVVSKSDIISMVAE